MCTNRNIKQIIEEQNLSDVNGGQFGMRFYIKVQTSRAYIINIRCNVLYSVVDVL